MNDDKDIRGGLLAVFWVVGVIVWIAIIGAIGFGVFRGVNPTALPSEEPVVIEEDASEEIEEDAIADADGDDAAGVDAGENEGEARYAGYYYKGELWASEIAVRKGFLSLRDEVDLLRQEVDQLNETIADLRAAIGILLLERNGGGG